MTARQAKKEAWNHAGLILSETLATGWPYEDEGLKELSEEDKHRLAKALREIADHCIERGAFVAWG